MTKIDELKDLTKKDWENLKEQARIGLVNSKIGYHQHTVLYDLASTKISEFKTDEEKSETEAIKDAIKELVA